MRCECTNQRYMQDAMRFHKVHSLESPRLLAQRNQSLNQQCPTKEMTYTEDGSLNIYLPGIHTLEQLVVIIPSEHLRVRRVDGSAKHGTKAVTFRARKHKQA